MTATKPTYWWWWYNDSAQGRGETKAEAVMALKRFVWLSKGLSLQDCIVIEFGDTTYYYRTKQEAARGGARVWHVTLVEE